MQMGTHLFQAAPLGGLIDEVDVLQVLRQLRLALQGYKQIAMTVLGTRTSNHFDRPS